MTTSQPSHTTENVRGMVDRERPVTGWGTNVLDRKGNIMVDRFFPEGFEPWTEKDGDNATVANDLAQEMRVFGYRSISNENHRDETYLPPSACWLDECTLFFVITMTQERVHLRNLYWPKQFDKEGDFRENRIAFGKGPVVDLCYWNDRTKEDQLVESYFLVYKHRWILTGEQEFVPKVADMSISCGHSLFRRDEIQSLMEQNKPYWTFGTNRYELRACCGDPDILMITVNQDSVQLSFSDTLFAERLERSNWLRCTNFMPAYLMDMEGEKFVNCDDLLRDKTVRRLPGHISSLPLQHRSVCNDGKSEVPTESLTE